MLSNRRFRVTVCRDRLEKCVVEVEAADPNEAAQSAFLVCNHRSFRGWNMDPADQAVYTPEGGVQEIVDT